MHRLAVFPALIHSVGLLRPFSIIMHILDQDSIMFSQPVARCLTGIITIADQLVLSNLVSDVVVQDQIESSR